MASRNATAAMLTEQSFIVCHSVDLFAPSEFPGDYLAMAVVLARDLEEVFALTNDTDAGQDTRRVIRLGCGSMRSTSVGDVVVEGMQQAYLCDNFGWTPLRGFCTVLPNWWLLG